MDVHYVLILNTNAGLWGYNIGDTIEFTSLNPYRIIVTGRIKHFTSAFGEHVIAKEVEQAMKIAIEAFPEVEITEFTVAPQIEPDVGLPHHEWFVEFVNPPNDINKFSMFIDKKLQLQNVYYKDLIQGKVLRPLVISVLEKNAFNTYMKSQGKLGGQNKPPRLANDRSVANVLQGFKRS
tara:strand:- start:1739 stop:2275 length:537 start_codon:yes stop_codon:yes gene_type:complete